MARCLHAAGVRRLAVAEANAAEAALVSGLEVVAVASLQRCVGHLDGSAPLNLARPGEVAATADPSPDLSEVRGQEQAKRALEIAAAGGHNLLMVGPPGEWQDHAGQGLLLTPSGPRHRPGTRGGGALLAAGRAPRAPAHNRATPFRSPHHSVSRAGLIGGGSGLARPGEISLAHPSVQLCY